MRVGTWNLEGRWDERHQDLIATMDCDVLLLTEVCHRVDVPGHRIHPSVSKMAPRRSWAAVAARADLRPLPDPHGATALVEWRGLRIASTVLPWRTCGDLDPWLGWNTAERTANAVAGIEVCQPKIWGGDWNHALAGAEMSGSVEGRKAIQGALDRLGLVVPTTHLPHPHVGLLSIDHVAVPAEWAVTHADVFVAEAEGVRISDHDAYVVEVEIC